MANEKKETNGKTGTRYTPEQKKEILDFYNAQEGRGKVTETCKKFGISYLSLKRWLEASDGDSKKKVGRPKGSKNGNSKSDDQPKPRGRKANPSIFALRLLEKIKASQEKDLERTIKAIEKISAK